MIFTNPLFLIGLVAVGIPIAVHLFNFRRYRKIYFSNVDRLQELQQETRRQSRLRERLILLSRILFVVFLVMAFAQPVIRHRSQQLVRGGSAISVYVDNSYSMENTGRDGQMLETAKQKAREIVMAYKPGDRYQLLTNSASGAEFRWLSRDEFLASLDAVEVVPVAAQMSSMVRKQQDFLQSSNADNKRSYVVSDFHRSTADVEKIECDTTLWTTLVPLSALRADNVYIDTMVLSAPVYYQGSTLTATVTIVNSGDQPVEKVPVRLYVNDKERAIAAVDIEAEGRVQVDMNFVVDQKGVLDGRVEISDYPITFDDQLFFVLNVRDRIRALEIDGVGANSYLGRLFVGDSAMVYRTLSIAKMDYAQITQQDYIVLNELENIPSGLAQSLNVFVEEGGSLTVIPAEHVTEESYNTMLSMFGAPRMSGWKEVKVKVLQVNRESSLYQNVFVGKNEDLELPTLTGYHKMVVDGGVGRESLMVLENGDDYLVLSRMGLGRLFLFAAPLRLECTDFVKQALFVPTLYNMALYSRPVSAAYALLGEGQTIMLNAKDVGEVSRLTDLQGKVDVIPDIRRMGGRCHLVTHGELKEAGCYRITTVEGEEGLAFNYPRKESELTFFDRADVQRMVRDNHLNHVEVIKAPEKSLESFIRSQNQGSPLWRWCLVLSLLALGAEILLVRMPRRKRFTT